MGTVIDERATRWTGVGHASSEDAHQAGADAATMALAGRDAALVVVFCSDDYDLQALLAGVNSATGGAPLVGCSTAGEIATAGPGLGSVVVMALGGSGFHARTAAATRLSSRLREAAAEVATAVTAGDGTDGRLQHEVLLLLTDGLAGDQQEIVRGAYSVVGASVPLVGGCAGDELRMVRTRQLHGTEVLTDAIVGVSLSSESPMGIGVRHGWRRVGEPMLVTSSDGSRVHALDERPALDAYLDRLDAPEEAHRDPAAFTRFALTHPLGLDRRSGEEVRFVAEADFGDRSLGCIAGVPQGGLSWIMEGDAASVLEATDQACGDALTALDGAPPIGVLAFDCIARRGVLGDEGITQEVARIGALVGGAPVAGFYTYGEIARTRGLSGFHNQTLVVLALS